MYAYGVVLFELLSGQLPYSAIHKSDLWHQVFLGVGHGYLKPDLTQLRSDTPKTLLHIINECLLYDRDKRPLFPQILTLMDSIVLNQETSDVPDQNQT